MERWAGRVAVVTGASAGIGAAIAQRLVNHGMKVVGLARRADAVQEMAASLEDAPGELYAVKTDLAEEEDILQAFRWVQDNLGGVDVLVNNAAALVKSGLTDGKTSDWRKMYDVNVLALSICTREAVQSMRARKVDDGHIIHINSVVGHAVPDVEGMFVYTSTKYAVTALAEGLRKELNHLKSSIRITSISPGAVDTDMIREALPEEVSKVVPMLKGDDIAAAVLYTLSAPARVQVHELTIHPTGDIF